VLPQPRRTLRGVVAHDTRHDPQYNAPPRGDEAGRRGRSHQTRDGARTPADHRPLPRQTPVEDHPGYRGEGGSQVGVPARHGRAQVGTKGGATVEAQPAEPEEDRSEEDEGDVVRAEVEHHPFLATAQDHRVREGGQTGADLDGATTGVVHDAVLVGPAVDVPRPAGEGAVDDGGPDEGEDHGRQQTAAFRNGAHDDRSGDGAELHLYTVNIPFPSTSDESPPPLPGRRRIGDPGSGANPGWGQPGSSSDQSCGGCQ